MTYIRLTNSSSVYRDPTLGFFISFRSLCIILVTVCSKQRVRNVWRKRRLVPRTLLKDEILKWTDLTYEPAINEQLTDWLTVWLIVWLSDCLTVWLSDCLIVWLSDCLTVWLTDLLTYDWLTVWLTHWLNDCLTYWLSVWINHKLTDWLLVN